jgi:hypothetical protein
MLARECSMSELSAGMILNQDPHNANGMLIVAKRQELTYQWIERHKGFSQRGIILVFVPSYSTE